MPKELEELKSQLEQHLEFYALERSQDRKKLDEILEVSRDNTKNIVLIMDTIKAPIAAWTAYIGAVKVGGWIGKVAKGFFWIIGTVLSFAVMVAIYIKTGIKIN